MHGQQNIKKKIVRNLVHDRSLRNYL